MFRTVSLVSGPSLWGAYGRGANMQEVYGPRILLRDEERTFHGSVVWPVYVQYRVGEAVRLFGGLTYAYGFGRWEASRHIVQVDARQAQEERLEQVATRGALTRAHFLGATVTLPSGLAAQFAFNGDLALYANWTISLGWRY